jgi:hypothetical protein
VETTRRIEITVETDEVIVIRRLGRSVTGWCGECGAQVEMVTAEEAACLAGVRWREMARRVEASRVHFAETPDGQMLICFNSISQ